MEATRWCCMFIKYLARFWRYLVIVDTCNVALNVSTHLKVCNPLMGTFGVCVRSVKLGVISNFDSRLRPILEDLNISNM